MKKALIGAAALIIVAAPMAVAHAEGNYSVTVDGKQQDKPNGSTASCAISHPSSTYHLVSLLITTNSSGFNPDYPISAQVKIVNGKTEMMTLAVPWLGKPGTQGYFKSTTISQGGAAGFSGDSQVANTGNTYKVSGHASEVNSAIMHAYEIDVTCP